MNRALEMFTRAWVAFAIIVNLVAIAGLIMAAPSFWAGWQRVISIYSSLNPINWLTELVLLAPAIGAYVWLQRRRTRTAKDEA
jgi:hypothetical protein